MSESRGGRVCTGCDGNGGRDSLFGNWKSCSRCDGTGTEVVTTYSDDSDYDPCDWNPDSHVSDD